MPLSAPTRTGSTKPRIYTAPAVTGRPGPCGCGCALTPETSIGFSAVEFAEAILGLALIPWQRWLLIHSLEVRGDGRFRFRTVLVLVARQNGKTTLVEVKNLWKMFVLRVPLVIGTAQQLDIAEESWDKAVELIESTPELSDEVAHVDRTNGKKALRLSSGSRWKIAAASRKGGRGLSGDDVNLDELREHHTWDSWGAVTKTTLARPKAQVWAFSNAGDDRSVVLNDLQEKGRRAAAGQLEDGSLGIFEWSAPDDCAVDDPEMWALANPSLGYTITEDSLRSALDTDPEPVFRTECLCQRVPDLEPSKIPLTAWLRCMDPESQPAGRLALSWEVAWDQGRASVGLAGFRGDGLPHLELVDQREGTEWVPERIAEIADRHDVARIVYDPASPAGSLATDVSALVPGALDPVAMTARDMAHACARIYDEAVWQDPDGQRRPGRLRHLGDDRLVTAIRNSSTRSLADAWAWDRKRSRGDISGLIAVTAAGWALATMPNIEDGGVVLW